MLSQQTPSENYLFDLAEAFIMKTSRSIFLTGKAGTGKTTFLRKVKAAGIKNTIVVAPTGVAAINAGGTTIHSFFQLPFSPFVPANSRQFESAALSDRSTLLQNLRIDAEKRNLFREMELLIIDEVSMVRADVLDSIDLVLRHFRRKQYLPFGGVQVLFIGDLYQLPPVVPQQEWNILRNFYESPFFFDSYVIREAPPLYIELKKIYRQTDQLFIDILNNVRNSELTVGDLDILNSRYDPAFKPKHTERFVTLTTHNHKADKINTDELATLPGAAKMFEGIVEGEFPERSFPTDKTLLLKEGAQIMFLRNDMEKVRRYYNGKIGMITRIQEDKIFVEFPNEPGELEVEKETWRNVRYSYNSDTRRIEEEVIGTFTQFAIRLAWAITIHKSQGLTFERAIIDAVDSFAPGQVYVALSRCTSLQGLILKTKIFRSSVMTDERVLDFAEQEMSEDLLTPILADEKKQFAIQELLEVFDWTTIADNVMELRQVVDKSKIVEKSVALDVLDRLDDVLRRQEEVSAKFGRQLRDLVKLKNYDALNTRLAQGIEYYLKVADESLLATLISYRDELKQQKKVRKVLKNVEALIDLIQSHKILLAKTSSLTEKIFT